MRAGRGAFRVTGATERLVIGIVKIAEIVGIPGMVEALWCPYFPGGATFLEEGRFIRYQAGHPMKFSPTPFLLMTSALAGVLMMVSAAFAEEPKPEPPRGPGGDEDRRPLGMLEKEERERLREALREVWTDPAVINAREEVKQASEAYRRAIRAAVKREHPEVGAMLERVEKANRGEMRKRFGGGPPAKIGPRRGTKYPTVPPGRLDRLSEEERERFRAAEAEAQEDEEVQKARAALRELRERDEDLRRERLRTHRQLRRALLDAMVEADPGIAEIREKLDDARKPGRGPRRGGGDEPRPPRSPEPDSAPKGEG